MKFRRSQLVLALAAGLCLSAGALAQNTTASAPVTSGSARPASASKYKLNAAQLAEAQARVQLANTIAQNVAADAKAKSLGDDWRTNLLGTLYNTPSSALSGMSTSISTLDQALSQANAAQQQAAAAKVSASTSAAGHASSAEDTTEALGSSSYDLVFTPMTPCRWIDTRVTGGAIGSTARVYDTYYGGGTYGGSSSCVLPGAGEPAIAVNVTIASPTAAGFLTVRSYGSTGITSWVNWYQFGANVQAANAGVISTAVNSSTSHYDFEVLTGGGGTAQVILDYFGYFSAAPATALNCTTGTQQNYSVAANFSGYHFIDTTCPSGYTAVATFCWNENNANIVSNGSGLIAFPWCGWRNLSTTTAYEVHENVSCCQVP
ncbi:MAG: hypothetical protein QM741_12895 [Rudaea sp.]|uniref:hypothetical protein n=1 Tax=Rudaea sp. TaxID=2136325 RepID=UPI0039E5A2DD